MDDKQRSIKKNVTIHDLAKELNVSPSTVSRALKDHLSIGEKTIKAVKKLAKERGYRPNNLAVSLRKQHSTNIGVLVPWINRPFISTLISGMEETARAAGYNVLISQSHDSYENEVDNVKAFYDSRICGLVVSLAMETQDYSHFEQFLKIGTPVVFVDRIPLAPGRFNIIIDNYSAAFKATQHLIQQDCRRIAHLGGAMHQFIYKERKRGYLEALQQSGLPVDESLILTGHVLSDEEGSRLTAVLLNLPNPPDGIFVANDTAAVSAIQYAKSVGIKIPEELAIIGFNNDPVCQIIEPLLSSVSHPAKEMGELAVEQVLKIISAPVTPENQTVTLETEVIARASSLRKNS